MNRPFPAFLTHAIASFQGCRHCGAPLHVEDAKDYGYPPNRGQYGLRCRKCECTFFYDLTEDSRKKTGRLAICEDGDSALIVIDGITRANLRQANGICPVCHQPEIASSHFTGAHYICDPQMETDTLRAVRNVVERWQA